MATATREILPPAIGSDELKRRQSELAANTKPTVFNVAGQLLAKGRTDTPLAATEDMSIRLKIYAEGGENELHAHPGEDHSFIVLQGSVRFYGPENEETVLEANQGIMLPKGNMYWFTAIPASPWSCCGSGLPITRNCLRLTGSTPTETRCAAIQKRTSRCRSNSSTGSSTAERISKEKTS